MAICGIDPGKHGAAVVLDVGKGFVAATGLVYSTPENTFNAGLLANFLSKHRPTVVVVERVRGRGGVWGATQNFNFGYVYGQLMQTLRIMQAVLHYEIAVVDPQVWQRFVYGKRPKDVPTKDAAAKAYGVLYPHAPLPTTPQGNTKDGIIDALLIAHWALYNHGNPKPIQGKRSKRHAK